MSYKSDLTSNSKMMKKANIFFITMSLIAIAFALWSFTSNEKIEQEVIDQNVLNDSLFNAYWYAGKAEIKTYNLTQSRYGELHKGTATVIFVTEPFLKIKGVKPNGYNKDQVPVLKMNLLKKFGTGIYPYSMMLSTFTSLQESTGMVKATASGQEWCGQIFSQMNQRKNKYDVVSYSYFEQEGDTQFTLPTVITEDEIRSRIRIDAKKLPLGEIDIIPGLYYTRLEQHQFKVEKAVASLKTGKENTTYTIIYPKRERTLAITFSANFPHEIIKWEETYADKRAPDKKLTTTAILNKSKNIDYWNYNKEEDKNIRKELGVPY